MKNLIVLLILGLIVHQHQVDAVVEKVLQLASFAWETFGIINTAHDTFNKFSTPSVQDVLDETDKIIQSLENQGAQIEEKLQQSMETLLTRLPLMAEIANDMRLLNTFIVRVDELYGDLKIFLEMPDYFDAADMRYLTKSWTSRDADDVQGTISGMFSLIVPQRLGKLKKSLFVLLAQESRGNSIEVCDTGAPPQQRLVELFNIAMESEMRSFAMYGFGLLIDSFLDKANYTMDIRRAEEKVLKRSKEYLKIFRSTVAVSGILFRRCDPPGGHEQGVTFHQFDRFLQSFVVQESAFRWDHRCTENCRGYNQPTLMKPECVGVGCDPGPETCLGGLTNCEKMANQVDICRATGSRRYEWYRDSADNSYGDDTLGCPQKVEIGYKRGSCDVCRCICVEDQPFSLSSHFISLREQITNVADNMVATGLAFVMVKKVLHVRVMQGKLESRAEVSTQNTSWVEPENIEYDPEKDLFVKKSEDGDDEDLITDKDVAALTLEQRRINLDTLSVPKNHVLTGVRFRRLMEQSEGNIQLEIQATAFEPSTGKLDLDSSIWLTAEDMPYAQEYLGNERNEYRPEGSRNPLKSSQTMIDSRPYTFMDVDWSSLEYDAAQTTLPLVDALPVTSDPPTALVGVGFFHKAKPGYGGFLTFVLEGIDQSAYLSEM